VSEFKVSKLLHFSGSTGLPDTFEYNVGDEPTFTVHGRVTDVSDGETWDGKPRRSVTFDVKAADIDEGDGVTLMLLVSNPVPVPARVARTSKFWAVVVAVWPLVTYVGGVAVGYSLR
jgi:hypothetical protein